jgi:hypothetical protein
MPLPRLGCGLILANVIEDAFEKGVLAIVPDLLEGPTKSIHER